MRLLRFENLAGSGAEAKAAVGSGHVVVNGKPETRKRRQIVAGDTIEFGNEKLFIKFAVSKPALASAPLPARFSNFSILYNSTGSLEISTMRNPAGAAISFLPVVVVVSVGVLVVDVTEVGVIVVAVISGFTIVRCLR